MKKKRGIPDEWAFKNLKTMEEQHKKILMKHLKDVMIKVNNGDASITEIMEQLKGILVSLNNLKKLY